ncbi:sugar kinase [Salinigranum rubrum]|uniref:Ribokinase n=1 Tax=Salinigranum rubrum TaxID=755307 RepID=A0A2I8VIM4_9EURY|nr:PfkB family carbohydrate kinase [Salinigranum rubrum]AUV81765.1 sugar kinase [Salinigranum rubrum]
MHEVVSLGSVNVDHVGYLSDDAVAALEGRYDWLPEPGETVAVDAVPGDLRDRLTEVSLGGKGANQAVAAALAGVETAFLGCVGDDEADYGVCRGISDRGVDVSEVARVDGPTGSAYIVVDESAENRITILAGANAAVDRAYVESRLDVVENASVLLLQNEIPTAGTLWLLDRLVDAPDAPTVVVDPAPAAGAEPLVTHEAVDVVVPNATEFAHLEPELAAFAGTLVVTHGGDLVSVSGPESFEVAPPAVDPVDTTGAGDIFTGYLAATLSTGGDLRAAVERASTAAALSTESEGVQPAVPDAETVDARC